MSSRTQAVIEEGLAFFAREIEQDPALARDFQASRTVFFGGSVPEPGSEAARFADRRHLEWFVHERFNEHLQGVPALVLRARWLAERGGSDPLHSDAFSSSTASIFLVTGVNGGTGAWLRDLLGGGEYPLEEPEAAPELAAGDLLVGRLYPTGDGLFRASPAAACFRSPGLLAAVQQDVEHLRAARRGSARVLQSELERMFFGPERLTALPPAQAALARAEAWLAAAEVSGGLRDEILAALVHGAPEPGAIPGLGDALGLALERLAIESDADLEQARRVLVEAWLAHAPGAAASNGAPSAAAPPETRTERSVDLALADFDRDRAAGADLEQLFERLERDLGLDDGDAAEDEDEDPGAAPDFPGVVGAMVEEFLWDVERVRGAHERELHEVLRDFGRWAEGVESLGVFENLSGRDVLLYVCCAAVERGMLPSADAARRLHAALADFASWSDEQHELSLSRELAERPSLAGDLARVAELNRALAAPEPAAPSTAGEIVVGELFLAPGGPELVLGAEQREPLVLPERAARHARSGDLLRAARGPDGLTAVLAFPPEACAFLRARSS